MMANFDNIWVIKKGERFKNKVLPSSGVGGDRTLVQTTNQQAFYMFIS